MNYFGNNGKIIRDDKKDIVLYNIIRCKKSLLIG